MKKLTAEKCREMLQIFTDMKEEGHLSLTSEYHLQAYEIALPVLEQKSCWISCSDRMPTHGDDVMVHVKSGFTYIAKYNSASVMFTCDDDGFICCVDVTHWQPLPTPPDKQPIAKQHSDDGWIEWRGSIDIEDPEPASVMVEVKFRSGKLSRGAAGKWRWASKDIIAYRVIENDGGAA